jgi:hypothetical protein
MTGTPCVPCTLSRVTVMAGACTSHEVCGHPLQPKGRAVTAPLLRVVHRTLQPYDMRWRGGGWHRCYGNHWHVAGAPCMVERASCVAW